MASGAHKTQIAEKVTVNLMIEENEYRNVKLYVMEDLCIDMILGLDFQSLHESVTLKLGGKKPPLIICGLSTLEVEAPSLFENLSPDCKPVAAKSRRYSRDDRKFIDSEVRRLLKEGIIEPSTSSWRSQVVVVKDK